MELSDTPAMAAPSKTKSGEDTDSPPGEHLGELRRLLIGPEQQHLAHLQQRLDDPLVRAEELSRTLPDAITLRATRDNAIAHALEPAIEESLKTAVKKNPRAIADAISPVLGPGIRKAIAATIMGMIQSLNQTLNHSFSLQGLKWRVEALRTQKSFAEVVLLNTLVYRVEQIFLIHRNTGIVLQHVESMDTIAQDPDLVSGMLTAIQDFVSDSFTADAEATLDTLRMGGDQSVWIEQSPHVFLAAVIRGTPPLELRNQFREMLNSMDLKFADAFESFQGDIHPFTVLKNPLEEALRQQVRESRNKTSPLLWVILAICLIAGGMWGIQAYRGHQQWQNFLSRLKSEPGLVVTESGKERGRYFVAGLRDPLAREPATLMKESRLDVDRVTTRWTPYYALTPELVISRARAVLAPPSQVRLSLSGDTLMAKGTAGHRWIRDFRRLCLTIPGIASYNDEWLVDADLERLSLARKRLEGQTISFPLGESQLSLDEETQLIEILDSVRDLKAIQTTLGIPVQIVIIGHTDATGATSVNLRLSRQRAEYILRYLIRNHINPSNITAIGLGKKDTDNQGITTGDDESHRIVSFKTFLASSPTGADP